MATLMMEMKVAELKVGFRISTCSSGDYVNLTNATNGPKPCCMVNLNVDGATYAAFKFRVDGGANSQMET